MGRRMLLQLGIFLTRLVRARSVSTKWRLSRCERAAPYLQRTIESCPAKAANPLSIACGTRSGNPGTSSRKTTADTEAEIAAQNQNRPVSIKFASSRAVWLMAGGPAVITDHEA